MRFRGCAVLEGEKRMGENQTERWTLLRAHFYMEAAQRLLMLGHERAAAVVLGWMDEEVRKLDH